MKGHVTVLTKEIRPRVTGKLTAESYVLGTGKQLLDEPSAQKKKSTLGTIVDSVKGIGSMAMDTVTDTLGIGNKSNVPKPKEIPDLTFPVENLRAIDLVLDVEIKHIRKGEEESGPCLISGFP